MIAPEMSERDFTRVSGFVHETWGLKMPAAKKTMLESRLARRLRRLGIESYGAYCDYLFSPEGQENELLHMVDVVTTHKTEFFREPGAFDFLMHEGLPELVRSGTIGPRRRLHCWSAGCSTGEEPYTLAMVLCEFVRRHPETGLDFVIFATDVSQRALDVGRAAIFPADRIEGIPLELRRRYLLRGKGDRRNQVRMGPQLREKVRFRRLNLMDPFGILEPMHLIFCRNVIIYFDRPTQLALLGRLLDRLLPDGYLVVGHSETANIPQLPLAALAPTVYRCTQ